MLQALGRFAKLWLNVWGCVALFAAMALGDPPRSINPDNTHHHQSPAQRHLLALKKSIYQI